MMLNAELTGLSNAAFVQRIYAALGEQSGQISSATQAKIDQHVTELAAVSRGQSGGRNDLD